MSVPVSSSLTFTGVGIHNVIASQCTVTEAFDPKTSAPPQSFKLVTAVWDTGATGSVICQEVVDALGLQPTGQTIVHGVNSTDISSTFLINVQLPNTVHFTAITVTLGKFNGFHMLIGMDIINRGDFVITNKGGITMFSFRCPSMHHVDYVAQHNAEVAKNAMGHGSSTDQRKAKPPKTHGKRKKK